MQVVQAERNLQCDASPSVPGRTEVGAEVGESRAGGLSAQARDCSPKPPHYASSKHTPGCPQQSILKPQAHEGCMPLAGLALELPASITPSAPPPPPTPHPPS